MKGNKKKTLILNYLLKTYQTAKDNARCWIQQLSQELIAGKYFSHHCLKNFEKAQTVQTFFQLCKQDY